MSRAIAGFVAGLCLLAGCVQTVPIEVTVRAPEEPPTGARVRLTTDDRGVGLELPLTRENAVVFTTTIEVPEGRTLHLGAKLSTAGAGLDAAWAPIQLPVTADAEAEAPQTVLIDVKHWDVVVPPGSTKVRFAVTVPPTSPLSPTLYLSGPSEALGGGRVKGVRLWPEPDGTFVAQVALPAGQAAEYQYNLGTSDNVETDAARAPVTRSVTPSGELHVVEDTVARWALQTLTGNIHAHELDWSAKGIRRRVIVYLPPGYDEAPSARYPVLYMHDGQNLMDVLTGASFGEWGVDETAEQLITAGTIEPLIIVGVYHGYSTRIAEYTPVPSAPYGGGDAEAYRQFLVETVKPFIDATYRTRPEAQSTGVAGSSLGGLVSMWLGLVEPDVFGRLGVLSPSIWWANRDIVTRVTALEAKLPLRIWLDMGTLEDSDPQDELDDARALRDALVAEGWTLGTDLHYLEAQGAGHNEPAWRARFDDVLTWLYPAP